MRWRWLFLCLAVVAGPELFLMARPASAQFAGYFGRNKVQYETFDFRILRTEHFDIYFYEEEREAAQMAARMAERWYARLSRVLNHEFRQRQPVILYANHPHFEQTNATPEHIGESTGGFTEILKRRVVLPMAGTIAESDHVLGHELVHAFQFDITGQGTGGPGLDVPGALRLPLWFIEGMAEYLSLGPVDPFTAMWMRDAAEHDDLPTISDLRNPRYFPYRYGHALWSFIAGEWGEARIGRILRLAGRSGNAPAAIQAVLEIPLDSLSAMWHQSIRDYYAPVLEATRAADEFGTRLIYEERSGGSLNLGPALSPDGSEIVFLSERGLFSIEMYLADARTGEVKRKITESALDPHFESLQFINSSGDWHPDGRRFVFSGVAKGQPVITVLDVAEGRRLSEFRLRSLGEIFGPVWSPDGRRVAFAAQVGGFLNLYLLDTESGEVARLTDDAWGDFQPSWSPDGRSLVFVTDRFTGDLETLGFLGQPVYRLARMDVETRRIEQLPSPPEADSWDPQWAPDGTIYFVSNHTGLRDIYRLDPGAGEIRRVTNLSSGVSGISKLSPALSVASETGQVAASVYREGPFNYEIYLLERPEVLAGEPLPQRLAVDPEVLPPRIRASEELVALLHNRRLGLADPITFEEEDYTTRLGLDFIGQPTLAVAASDFGVFFAGGANLFFSDMLGDVTLATIFQVSSRYGDVLSGTAAIVGYENRRTRWNWGVLGGQIPYLSRFFRQALAGEQGEFLLLDDFRFVQVNREARVGFAYPFNRAQRVEFMARGQYVDFEFERRRFIFDRFTGQLLDRQETDAPRCEEPGAFPGTFCVPGSLVMGTVSAALVFDNSIFGGTAPIVGNRYRLEVTPTFGTLNFLSVLGDYRQYVMLVRPLAIAGRALHFGRYGSGGEDERLSPLFLGYPQLVRGYDFNSFEARECLGPVGLESSACPVFDQLLGSRIGVVNAELRLPLLGGIGLVPAPGFPPIDVGAFFDAGIAWTSELDPCLSTNEPGSCREPVKSYGLFTRMNLFGLLIAELDYVNPVDRPERDWFFQFSLKAGF